MREVDIVETLSLALSAKKGHSFVDVVWFGKSRVESAPKALYSPPARHLAPLYFDTLPVRLVWPRLSRQCSSDHNVDIERWTLYLKALPATRFSEPSRARFHIYYRDIL
jgi:hypothetical protein